MKTCKGCKNPAKCMKAGECMADMKKGAYKGKESAAEEAKEMKLAKAMGLKK